MTDKMIDTDRYFDDYQRNVRTVLMWVYPTELRTIVEKAVDLQVEAGKFAAKSVNDTFLKFASFTPTK